MKTEPRCLEPKDTAPDRRAATGYRPIAVFALTDTPILAQGLKAIGHALSRQLSISACIFDLDSGDVPWGDSHPDVVLLDMDMGPEKVLPWLKHWQPHSPFKVLLLSRNPDDGLLEQALLAGARGHLDHRASLDTLLRAIEKIHQGEIWVERKATTRLLKNWIEREQSMPQEDLTQLLTHLTVREHKILAALNKNPRPKGRGICCTTTRTLRGSSSFYSALRTLSFFARPKGRGIRPASD